MFIEAKILENAAALNFKQGRFGITRKADISQVQTDADKDMLKMTKILLDSPEYEEIIKHQNETRRYLRDNSVPLVFLESTMLFNVKDIEKIEEYLKEREEEQRELVDKFCAVYEQQKEEARRRLNGQFDPRNYPPVEVVRSMFYMQTRWIKFGIPDNLPEKIFQQEKEKAEKAWAEATEVIIQTLRESFKQLIDHAAKKLKFAPGEKPPVFKRSMIENVKEFIATFNSRNLANDVELEKLVNQAKTLLESFYGDAEIVRRNLALREYVAEKFEEINASLDAILVERPSRKFQFEEAA